MRSHGLRPELRELGADIDADIVDQDATAAQGGVVLHQIARLGRVILVLLVVGRGAAIEDLDPRLPVTLVTECLATTLELATPMAAIRARTEDSTGASA